METNPFRDSHILKACKSYETQNLPVDRHLSAYFKHNKSIGSKDRAYISQAIYTTNIVYNSNWNNNTKPIAILPSYTIRLWKCNINEAVH